MSLLKFIDIFMDDSCSLFNLELNLDKNPWKATTEDFQPSQNIIERPRVYSIFFIIQI